MSNLKNTHSYPYTGRAWKHIPRTILWGGVVVFKKLKLLDLYLVSLEFSHKHARISHDSILGLCSSGIR